MIKRLLLLLLFTSAGFFARAQVTTLYGSTSGSSSSGTAATSAKFNRPYAAVYNSTASVLWITDQDNNYLDCITNNNVYVREGSLGGGFQDGGGAGNGLMAGPKGIVLSPKDSIYLVDWGGNAVRKVTPWVDAGHSQYLSTIAGGGPGSTPNFKDGVGKAARFLLPTALGYVVSTSGDYLVVVDAGNHVLRKVSLAKADYGTVTLLAGTAGTNGSADGTLKTALFDAPLGIYIDPSNNDIYITDNNGIRLVSIAKSTVTTILPQKYLESNANSVVKVAGNLYISQGCNIVKFPLGSTPAFGTNPSIFAGDPADTSCDFKDGSNAKALFNNVSFLTATSDGKYLIATDQDNSRIRKITIGNSAIEDIQIPGHALNIYPNPAFGHVMVKSEKTGHAIIRLMNMTGQIMLQNQTDLVSGQPYDMDLAGQAPGVYILQVSSDTGIYSSRIIIK